MASRREHRTPYLFPGHAELDVINPDIDMFTDNFSHLFRAIRKGCDPFNERAVTPCHLFAIG
jgi:hypothetical protein